MLKTGLVLQNVSKNYGSKLVVDSVYLNIKKGDFLTILGPSGGGKTTVLKMISGFENISSGQIFLDGKDLENTPSNKRNFGMLFQNYALFPHMTVEQNVAYPLKIRKISKKETKKRVADILNTVGLEGFYKRLPSQLSGGQQQRVALARALVFNPDVLLLDEPLAALDKQLRKQMQIEIKSIHDKFGLTTISVTHDQEEALTMATKVCVMKSSKIQQIDTPDMIYNYPVNTFVANFIGESTILKGKVISKSQNTITGVLDLDGRPFETSILERDFWVESGMKVNFNIRPEKVKIVDDNYNGMKFSGIITQSVYLGEAFRINATTESGLEFKVKVFSRGKYDLSVGSRITIGLRPNDLVLLKEDD